MYFLPLKEGKQVNNTNSRDMPLTDLMAQLNVSWRLFDGKISLVFITWEQEFFISQYHGTGRYI
jgi:hypothetical protein